MVSYLKQTEKMSNSDYLNRMKTLVENVEDTGATVGYSHERVMTYVAEERAGHDGGRGGADDNAEEPKDGGGGEQPAPDPPTEAELRRAKTKARNEFVAILLIILDLMGSEFPSRARIYREG